MPKAGIEPGIKLRAEYGYISLLILMVITFLSGVGYAAYYKASSEEKTVRYEAQKIQAIYLADSGLEWGKTSLTADPFWKGGSKLFAGGVIEVTVSENSQGYRVIARSKIKETSQSRYGVYTVDSEGNLVLTSYGELFN